MGTHNDENIWMMPAWYMGRQKSRLAINPTSELVFKSQIVSQIIELALVFLQHHI